jgi:Tetratricopeptide repeat
MPKLAMLTVHQPGAAGQLFAELMHERAWILLRQGQQDAALPLVGSGLDLARRLQVGAMLGSLGHFELSAGDLDAARRHLAESLDIARALNDRYGAVYHTLNLGVAEYLGGSPDAAEALSSRAAAAAWGVRTGLV